MSTTPRADSEPGNGVSQGRTSRLKILPELQPERRQISANREAEDAHRYKSTGINLFVRA